MMNQTEFDNEVVCRAVYAWLKGDGSEPYSPVVASLTRLVLEIVDADRCRVASRDPRMGLALGIEHVRSLSGQRPNELQTPNMDAARGAFEAIGWCASCPR